MIRINADLLPFGSEDDRHSIGVLEIGNRGGFGEVCDYDFRFGATDPQTGEPAFERWKLLIGHRRRDGIWGLVGRICAERDSAPDSDYNQTDSGSPSL